MQFAIEYAHTARVPYRQIGDHLHLLFDRQAVGKQFQFARTEQKAKPHQLFRLQSLYACKRTYAVRHDFYHRSRRTPLLDVVLLISHFSNSNVPVKKDLLNNPSMKGEIIASGYIPNDESMEMLEEIDAVFKSGQSLLIFPEGTRAGWDGQVKIGIARFAQCKKTFGFQLDGENDNLRENSANVKTLAEFVKSRQA